MAKKIKLEEKFFGNKPLLETVPDYYPDKYLIKYNKFEKPKKFDLWEGMRGKWLPEPDYEITFGIKAKPEEFYKYDFLWCPDGPAFVAHRRIVDKLAQMCPDDFQAFQIELKNLDPKMESFVNRDYYLINILNLVEAIDKEKTIIEYSDLGVPYIYNLIFKENCMGNILLARDSLKRSHIIFRSDLARELANSKGIEFISDIEDLSWVK